MLPHRCSIDNDKTEIDIERRWAVRLQRIAEIEARFAVDKSLKGFVPEGGLISLPVRRRQVRDTARDGAVKAYRVEQCVETLEPERIGIRIDNDIGIGPGIEKGVVALREEGPRRVIGRIGRN